MSSIINALSDLVSSLVELVWSFFTTSVHLVENTGKFAAKFANEIIDLIINFFKGLVDLAGGIVSFLVGKWQSVSPCIPSSNIPRQCYHARRSGCSLLRLPPVPAQPGTFCSGR
jgi:phage-related protein